MQARLGHRLNRRERRLEASATGVTGCRQHHHADYTETFEGSPRERELEGEIEQLRERVKVLERIATDPARRTAEEIEKLRDD